MPKPLVTDDPQVLATLIRGMGGTPVAAENFRFDLPLEKVREVVPRLNDLGLRVFKVSERVTNHRQNAAACRRSPRLACASRAKSPTDCWNGDACSSKAKH